MEVRDFVGGMLLNVRRFKIEAGSWRPSSKSGQQQLALDLYKQGLLPMLMMDPEQHRLFLELMGLDNFEAQQSDDYKRAKLENEQLLRSTGWEVVQREPGDDDLVHLAVHTRQRKQPEWAKVPNVVKSRLLQHEIQHLMAIVEADGAPDISANDGNPEEIEGQEDPTGQDAATGQPPAPSGGNENGDSDAEPDL